MALTYDQATQQATQLRAQGATWPAIADHLRRNGYTSPFTKQPVGHLAVRHMVIAKTKEVEEMPTKVEDAQKPGATIVVSSPKGEALEAIKTILSVKGMPVQQQYELVEYLLRKAAGEGLTQQTAIAKVKRTRRTKEQMQQFRQQQAAAK